MHRYPRRAWRRRRRRRKSTSRVSSGSGATASDGRGRGRGRGRARDRRGRPRGDRARARRSGGARGGGGGGDGGGVVVHAELGAAKRDERAEGVGGDGVALAQGPRAAGSVDDDDDEDEDAGAGRRRARRRRPRVHASDATTRATAPVRHRGVAPPPPSTRSRVRAAPQDRTAAGGVGPRATPPRACARRLSRRRHATRGEECGRCSSRGEAAVMREACDDVESWCHLLASGRSRFIRATGRLSFRAGRRTDGNIAGGGVRARDARTSGTRPKTGRGERGERVGRSGLPSGVTLCIGVHQESSALRSCVRAVIRRKNGETGGGKAHEGAPHGRPSPRVSPRSTGVVRWSRRAHRPQTEKFTVCAHRARGCWVGDDPPSDASLALCARLMSSRGGVGGVDGDDRARRSTRRGHWRRHPRCQRRALHIPASAAPCHEV